VSNRGGNMIKRWITMALALLLLFEPAIVGQICAIESRQVAAFMGTWAISMTEPQGGHETVKIWDKGGVIAASVQSEQSPPIDITGFLKDGDMLVLTATRFENGRPVWALISLTVDGDTISMAQVLQPSRTIKRGSGTRQ
jgi:hypothetical protein